MEPVHPPVDGGVVRCLQPLHEPGEEVYEPLRLPVGLVEEQTDEGEEPDVRFRVAVGFPDLPFVLLLQLPLPLLHHGGVEVEFPPSDESLVVAVPVPLI